jgi:multiple sugar transport system substrate-binding protein
MAWVLIVGLVMSACAAPAAPAPAAEEAGPAETAGEPSGTVNWWALAEFNFEPFAEDLEAAYEAHSPNVDLQMEILPEAAYLERLLPALASGTGPDIVVLEFVPTLSRPTALLDLTSYIEGPNGVDLSQWDHSAMVANAIFDGKVYGLPRDLWGGLGWFINKDLFDQAGVPYPAEDWTWADLEEIAPQLSDKENRLYGFAVGDFLELGSFGVQYISDDFKTVVGYMDSPDAIAAFKTWKFLYDCCSPTIEQQATEFQDIASGGMGPVGAFVSGLTAIAPIDPGVHEVMTEAGINWGYVPRPMPAAAENRHKPSLNYVHWGVNANTTNPDAAWDFVKWLTAKDGGQAILAQAGYFVPFRENLEAANYPEEILSVRFMAPPADWKEPIPPPWGIPCFGEAGTPELGSTTQQVLSSPPEQLEQIVHEGAARTQEALDACWELRAAGEGD